MNLLIANVGSTSFKFQLFEGDGLSVLARGRLERIGSAEAPVQYRTTGKPGVAHEADLPDYEAAIRHSIRLMTDPAVGVIADASGIAAVGFKPVHAFDVTGCRAFTDDVLAKMEAAAPLAPAHNPPYIAAVRLFRDLLPGMPLFGLFEPTFHATMPDHATVYGAPYAWIARYGIRRYGFHGASHRYIAERTPGVLGREAGTLKIVSCHLGGSSSVCAIAGGRSVDTSMGLTPQSGVMQSSRNGDLDPFAVLYVMDREKRTTDEMRAILCRQSGLKGLSGIDSGDMRDVLDAARRGNKQAQLAVNAYTYDIKKYIGAYAAAMGGLDVVAFTGGIGERSAEIRARVCDGLDFLGVSLDAPRNETANGEAVISPEHARVAVVVIPADEEYIVAREMVRVLKGEPV